MSTGPNLTNLKTAEEVKEYLKNLYIEYRFGCESEKRPEVCHLLGDYEESINNDNEKAARIYKENCDTKNNPRSCGKYGSFALVGRGVPKNVTEAYEYSKKGCELGDGQGCYHAGIIATSTEKLQDDRAAQIAEGFKMLKKSCWEQNNDKGCYYLSGLYLGGLKDFVKPDLREAYKVSLKACEGGNPYACANLAQMHARGEGAEKNENLSEAFKQRAIELHRELTKPRRGVTFGG